MPSEVINKFSLRIGDFEIQLEGSEQYINSIIGENIFDFIDSIQTSDLLDSEMPEETTTDITDLSTPPKISKVTGLNDALKKLFDTDWGKTPRSLPEIKKVLELNGIFYESNDIASRLVKLLRTGEIRRIGQRRKYRYVGA